MARWTPSRSRPGTSSSLASVEPQARQTASNSPSNFSTGKSTPTLVLVRKTMPSAAIRSTRRCTTFFSSLNSGMPRVSRPPMYPARSMTVTRCPARFSCWAAAKPEGPDPTTTTFLPVRLAGGSGLIQPFSYPCSTISFSMYSMVTGSALILRTQLASQGAGHTRPVNSGKLLVDSRVPRAPFQSPK